MKKSFSGKPLFLIAITLTALIALLIVALGFFCWKIYCFFHPKAYITTDPIIVDQAMKYHAPNYNQLAPNLFVYNQELYYYVGAKRNPHSGWVSKISDGSVESVFDLRGAIFVNAVGEYIYYAETTPDYLKILYCYSLKDSTSTRLVAFESLQYILFHEDGSVYVPICNDSAPYYKIEGTQVSEIVHEASWLQSADRSYLLKGIHGEQLFCIQNGVEEEISIPYGYKSIFRYQDGILVHNNQSEGYLLYYIDDATGAVQELFSVPSIYATSSVTFFEDYIFLSFSRKEKYGEFGLVPFENDTIQGTYRIDFCDGSAIKISDAIYRSMFIFNDGSIYATDDDGQIFLIDFNGNCIDTLLYLK